MSPDPFSGDLVGEGDRHGSLSFPNCKSDNIRFDSEHHQPYRVEITSLVTIFIVEYVNLFIKGQFNAFIWGWTWEHMLANWDVDPVGFKCLIDYLIIFIHLILGYLVYLSTELWYLLYYLV